MSTMRGLIIQVRRREGRIGRVWRRISQFGRLNVDEAWSSSSTSSYSVCRRNDRQEEVR